MNQNKVFRVMEIIWLALGIFSLFMAVYLLITGNDYKMVLYFLAIGVIAALKYVWRRKQRIASGDQNKTK
jgi:hypothetical protein